MNYSMPTAIVIYNIKALLFMSCDYFYNLLSKTNLLNLLQTVLFYAKHTSSLEEVLQLRSKHYF